MKTIAAILLTAFLAGCATTSPLGVFTHHAKKAPVVKAAPVVVEPPATFKARWYDKFRKHPRWFHPK